MIKIKTTIERMVGGRETEVESRVSDFRFQVREERSGQAIIELMAGLTIIVIVSAFLFQMTTLTRVHTDMVLRARYEGGVLAQQQHPFSVAAEYIHDWDPGADSKRYTVDDETTSGDAGRFTSDVVDYAGGDPAGWSVLDASSNAALPSLRGAVNPAALFGLIRHRERQSFDVLPAVRSLLYRADTIDLEYDVWMTHARVD